MPQAPLHPIAIAPMMDWTDRHDRYFLRLITQHSLLYTEMVTTGALIHGDRARFLNFHPLEHPISLQLGGSEPQDLARCAQMGEEWGYDEINLNVGCPSDRVQAGRFGACLMVEPQLVAECVSDMQAAVKCPITVKTRIGIDEHDSYAELQHFIQTLMTEGGCSSFIIHARKAWLKGLSPRQNREIPPLRYDVVKQLKVDFPHAQFMLNGGIKTHEHIAQHMPDVDGIMLGRAAYQNPYLLATVDRDYYTSKKLILTRQQIVEKLYPYIEQHLRQGGKLKHITRHILGLFQHVAGAKRWRRHLSEYAVKSDAGIEVLQVALALTQDSCDNGSR